MAYPINRCLHYSNEWSSTALNFVGLPLRIVCERKKTAQGTSFRQNKRKNGAVVHKKDFVDIDSGDLGWHLSDGGLSRVGRSNLLNETSQISFFLP